MPENKNYILLMGWMVNDLHLKGNELLVYAIIYGFSQDGVGEFAGSLKYLSDWLNITRQTVINTLKSLEDRKLVVKNKQVINGVQIARYRAIVPASAMEIAPEKKPKEAIDYQAIVDDYNKTCPSLPQCRTLSEARKTLLSARLKQHGRDKLHQIFAKAEESDFLSGRKSDFHASLDWLLKDANAVKVLDGNYDNRRSKSTNNQPPPDAPLEDWEKDWLNELNGRTGGAMGQ
ncbi:MAG: helix-turn-helix domain-containing protein [Eubacteriales bacterium]|nr:helix-turn-helix domain-containing protein [Eubacteriales bacterium]